MRDHIVSNTLVFKIVVYRCWDGHGDSPLRRTFIVAPNSKFLQPGAGSAIQPLLQLDLSGPHHQGTGGSALACSRRAATPHQQYVGNLVSVTACWARAFERGSFSRHAIQHAHEYLYKHATNLRILVKLITRKIVRSCVADEDHGSTCGSC